MCNPASKSLEMALSYRWPPLVVQRCGCELKASGPRDTCPGRDWLRGRAAKPGREPGRVPEGIQRRPMGGGVASPVGHLPLIVPDLESAAAPSRAVRGDVWGVRLCASRRGERTFISISRKKTEKQLNGSSAVIPRCTLKAAV